MRATVESHSVDDGATLCHCHASAFCQRNACTVPGHGGHFGKGEGVLANVNEFHDPIRVAELWLCEWFRPTSVWDTR